MYRTDIKKRINRPVFSGALVLTAALLISGCAGIGKPAGSDYTQTEKNIPAFAEPLEYTPVQNNTTADDNSSLTQAGTTVSADNTSISSDNSADSINITADKTPAEVQQAIHEAMPGMDCWGDSITEGFLGNGETWPKTLSELLDKSLIDPIREATGYSGLKCPEVRNMGVSTETVPEITGRRGAVPFVLTKDVTIPADKTEVEIRFASSDRGQTTKPLRYGDGSYGDNGINPVTIAGIRGTLSRYFDPSIDSSRYLFERLEAGDAVDVHKGEEVTTCAGLNGEDLLTDTSQAGAAAASPSPDYRSDFCVVMMGANGGYKDAGDLGDQFEKMAKMQGNDSFLLIGMGCTPEDSGLLTEKEEAYLTDRFGDRFISLQAWMSEHGVEYANKYFNAGLDISDRDQERIDKGYTPYCLLNEDGLHYTPTGYKVIGYMIFDEMDKRGYFDDLKTLAGLSPDINILSTLHP
ncbi:MAG: hypothetical protein K6C95_10540 [Lachnospiraceae bacterium]|nr:hypothetical protein [Lachnospiraceae bacterium]